MISWFLGAFLSLLACRSGAPDPIVVLISLDTTRADALSCYPSAAGPVASTPHICGASDVRFAWALAHAPTTLSSHASVFTGLTSHGHGVVRNGFPLRDDLPVLAERFASAGWDTRAVIGASTLAADMGLDRGFAMYDDDVETAVRHRYEDSADRVTERALRAVDGRRAGRPLFLFVHYFDAHSPWRSAPTRVRERFASVDSPLNGDGASIARLVTASRAGTLTVEERTQARGLYLAEVAWVDENVGALLDGLAQRGLDQDQLVVVFGDHGETLGEIPSRPYGHGLDVDLVDIHVPLLLGGTGRFALPEGTVVDTQVSLSDVGPTLLSLAGIEPALGRGRDLSPTWSGGSLPVRPHFAEATKPFEALREDAWPNLDLERAVAMDGTLFTRAVCYGQPQGRFFALSQGQPSVQVSPLQEAKMRTLLDAWDAHAPGYRSVELDDQTRKALQALGYLDAP